MNKIIYTFNDLRPIIIPEIRKALIEYQKYTTFRLISEILDIHSSYLSLIRHNTADKISLSSLLDIANKLGLRYQLEINNLQSQKINVTFTFDHSKISQHIEYLTAQGVPA